MGELRVTLNTGAEAALDEGVVEAFRASLRGPLLRAGDAGYHEARTIWNGMIDRRPALIARCAGVADVTRPGRWSRKRGLHTQIARFCDSLATPAGGPIWVSNNSCHQSVSTWLLVRRFCDTLPAAARLKTI